jgi:hypothetical protein
MESKFLEALFDQKSDFKSRVELRSPLLLVAIII